MKKISALILIVTLVLSLCMSSFGVSASIAPVRAGDVDMDDQITVKDATLTQKHLSELVSLHDWQIYACEVDGDKKVTVKDATMIQKIVAGIVSSPVKEWVYWDFDYEYANSTFESGRAVVGTPVVFTTEADNGYGPFTYLFYINDVAVAQDDVSDNKCEYTFDSPGDYKIDVEITNALGVTERFNNLFSDGGMYTVVDSADTDTLTVSALCHNQRSDYIWVGADDFEVTAYAAYGSGEYEYAFYMDGELIRDYSQDNVCSVGTLTYDSEKEEYIISVSVRDMVTGNTATHSMTIYVTF